MERREGLHPLSPALAARALAASLTGAWPAYERVEVGYELVPVHSLESVVAVLAEERVRGAQATLAAYGHAGLPPYLPVLYELNGTVRLAFGPVAEAHPGGLVLIDGANRSYVAWRSGLTAIDVAVIRAEHMPPPAARPRRVSALRVTTGPRPSTEKFPALDRRLFRPATTALLAAERRLFATITNHPGRGLEQGAAAGDVWTEEGNGARDERRRATREGIAWERRRRTERSEGFR